MIIKFLLGVTLALAIFNDCVGFPSRFMPRINGGAHYPFQFGQASRIEEEDAAPLKNPYEIMEQTRRGRHMPGGGVGFPGANRQMPVSKSSPFMETEQAQASKPNWSPITPAEMNYGSAPRYYGPDNNGRDNARRLPQKAGASSSYSASSSFNSKTAPFNLFQSKFKQAVASSSSSSSASSSKGFRKGFFRREEGHPVAPSYPFH